VTYPEVQSRTPGASGLILEERSDGERSRTNPLDFDTRDWRVTYSADEAPARAARDPPEQAMTRESACNSRGFCELSGLSTYLRCARSLKWESDYLSIARITAVLAGRVGGPQLVT
jgi:hypothetical protein